MRVREMRYRANGEAQKMIDDLNRTLKKLFQQEFGAALPFDLSFSIPDKNFKTVSNAKITLDCYLYDIRENRELRSVEPLLKRNSDGTIEKDFPPARIKLSYCITAWSPAQTIPGAEPELDEHSLLSQVLVVLLKYPTLPAAALVGVLVGQVPPLPPQSSCLTALINPVMISGMPSVGNFGRHWITL